MTNVQAIYNFEQKGPIAYLREDMFGLVSPSYKHLTQEEKTCIPMEGYVAFTGHNYIFADTDMVKKLS